MSEHNHSHSHPHRSHSKSLFHRIRPEIFAIVIAIIVIILGAIAGERLKPSQRQPQLESSAYNPCTSLSCCTGCSQPNTRGESFELRWRSLTQSCSVSAILCGSNDASSGGAGVSCTSNSPGTGNCCVPADTLTGDPNLIGVGPRWTTCSQGYYCQDGFGCFPSSGGGGGGVPPPPTVPPVVATVPPATKAPTRTPTKQPTRTPTKPPSTTVSSTCTTWAIDENSGTDSQLVKVNPSQTGVTLVKTYPCSGGICNIEAMDSNNSGQLYLISNTKKALYKVNTKSSDSIPDGTLTYVATLSPAYNVIAMSFRKSDNTLWAWAPGRGLYIINPTTGAMTLKLASKLDYVDGIAWLSGSPGGLWLSRTPGGWGNTNNQLSLYNPAANTITFHGPLPGDTDALDSNSGGELVGAYRGGSGTVKIYRYNKATKSVVGTSTITTPYNNFDALAVCVPN